MSPAHFNKAKASGLLSIVDAAYCVDLPAQEWTSGLLAAADRALGARLGGFAFSFRVTAERTIAIDRSSAAVVWQVPELVRKIFDGSAHAPPSWLSAHLMKVGSAGRCFLTSEVDPELKASCGAELARTGVHDGINVCCLDVDREGFLLSLAILSRAGFTSEVRRSLAKVATSLLAALRLRKRLMGPRARGLASTPDSVGSLLPKERALLHAVGDDKVDGARRALRAAVLEVERVRTSLQTQSGPASAAWKRPGPGRWCLIEEFDSHKAKYIVARDNAPQSGLAFLTPTERCVVTYAARGLSTKEIAYTLRLSAATVRVLIMRAVRRYGVRNREELLQLCKEGALPNDA